MDSSQLSKGTILQGGKYCIESVLGQGGFGITYLATQDILDRKVAIKEFFMRDYCNRERDTSSVTLGTTSNRNMIGRYMDKFLKEARTIATLNHPNIIHIYDIFRENNTAYYQNNYKLFHRASNNSFSLKKGFMYFSMFNITKKCQYIIWKISEVIWKNNSGTRDIINMLKQNWQKLTLGLVYLMRFGLVV